MGACACARACGGVCVCGGDFVATQSCSWEPLGSSTRPKRAGPQKRLCHLSASYQMASEVLEAKLISEQVQRHSPVS